MFLAIVEKQHVTSHHNALTTPFGNWTLSFGKKVLSNSSQGPFSVITVHVIAESTQWKEN
jgi:hypothetical protein